MYQVDIVHENGYIIQEPVFDTALKLFNTYLPYFLVRLYDGENLILEGECGEIKITDCQ